MIIDEIENQLNEGKTAIRVKGPLSEPAPIELWTEVNLISFDGSALSYDRTVDENIGFRGEVFLSGSIALGVAHQHQERIDNCHKEEGLHQHKGELIFPMENQTIRDALGKLFIKNIDRK